ncbi:hypothetical protein C2G38_2204288 [Gigaspora rosea]|uniref:Uncharacterized protein n=1 Tax=Gigaspora rosea TaxID=44941 RepID=A0A397UV88_9GLOM|nr:hypothetical protein C2G38_2204288 [Gigaspora rosea]
MARPEGVKVDRISLSPTFKNDQFYFNDTLYKLVWSWRLLQGDRPRFEKLILSDISIHLTFTSVHPGQLGNLVGLALWDRMTTPFKPNEEEERVPNGDEVAQMVMEQFKVPVASGLPVFFSNRSIEIAYQYNASIENTFALAQVIAQELRGGNDNVMDQRAYIQFVTEKLQEEAEEEAEEATDSDKEVDAANQANPTPLPSQPKQNDPKPNPSPLPSPTLLPTLIDNLFEILKKEIEKTQIEDAINFVDNKTMDQKIKNSKLQNNQIDQLQKIRSRRLKQFQGELYEDNVNQITRLDNVNDLNRLFDNINSDQNLMKLKQELKKKQILQNWKHWNLKGNKIFDRFKKEIENEAFISNLLDGNLHNTLITNDALLSEEQKEKLHELRKQQIVALSNKIYYELKNNIRNERIISRLDDKGYYDSIIAETEDALFDTLSEIFDFTEDLEELTDKLQITSDIQKLNQSLLTNKRYIDQLDKKRKTCYHNNLYDNVEVAINIETEIKKLQDNWKIKIDTKINQTFLLLPRSIEKIHQIREVRIATLQKPPKGPSSEDSDEENFLTRLPDNAKPVRNTNGNIKVQISFIVNEYKHTLNADNKKKFNRIKMDYVKKLIKDAHTKSKAEKSLLDILYYSWVIGKDDKFLLTKYTKRKIEDIKVLIKNIDDYIWLISTKKIEETKRNRLEKDPKYKNPAQYPILFNPDKFSLKNPLGFPEEYINDKENIKQIIIQYQQSLKNQSEISTDNLEKMQIF